MTEQEMKAALEKALADIEALKSKNAELIAEKRKAKDAADAAEAAREEAEEEKARTAGDAQGLEAKLTAKHAKEIAKLTKERDEATSHLTRLTIDNGIATALGEHNVLPAYRRALTAMIKAETALENGEALAGGKPLSEYIADFVASDEGKSFVAAPANSGGLNITPATTVNPSNFGKDNFNIGEWMALSKTDPAQAKAVAATAGRTDLANLL